MQMTENEIKRNYNEAKNKNQQIGILADLNCCSKKEIEKILGFEEKSKPKSIENENCVDSEKYISFDYVMNRMFSMMDEIDRQIKEHQCLIKELERKYTNIVIALKTIGDMERSN